MQAVVKAGLVALSSRLIDDECSRYAKSLAAGFAVRLISSDLPPPRLPLHIASGFMSCSAVNSEWDKANQLIEKQLEKERRARLRHFTLFLLGTAPTRLCFLGFCRPLSALSESSHLTSTRAGGVRQKHRL